MINIYSSYTIFHNNMLVQCIDMYYIYKIKYSLCMRHIICIVEGYVYLGNY